MARIPRQESEDLDQRAEEAMERQRTGAAPRRRPQLDDAPTVIVLGLMDGNIAIKLGWRPGMRVVSNSRFKFMREELEMNIVDNPDEYLF